MKIIPNKVPHKILNHLKENGPSHAMKLMSYNSPNVGVDGHNLTNLLRKGLVNRTTRGVYEITEAGLKAIEGLKIIKPKRPKNKEYDVIFTMKYRFTGVVASSKFEAEQKACDMIHFDEIPESCYSQKAILKGYTDEE